MGHSDVSRTFQVYGGWVREMGANAAQLRSTWIETTTARDSDVTTASAIPPPAPK